MALTFDFSSIEDWEKTCLMPAPDDAARYGGLYWWDEERIVRGPTQDLIFAMMGCGIGPELTEQVAPELWGRVQLMHKLVNCYERITPELIQSHVGLRVNVNYEAWSKWSKRIVNASYNEWVQEFKHGTR